jgi:predicted CXXCH cytochrome family protein
VKSIPRKVWLGSAALVVLALSGFAYIKSGGLIARQNPSGLEGFVANHILAWSVPRSASRLESPLKNTAADIAEGRERYLQKCQSCHGTDGAGRVDAGRGLYPPAVSLRSHPVQSQSDGTLFYFIRNGIRNTGMPGWELPDREIWTLVAYIRSLPKTTPEVSSKTRLGPAAHYLGSVSCQKCHGEIYDQWKKTRMANVVTDPKVHPESIIPDFSQPHPLASFTPEDIAFVYGSRWKQRYFTRIGDDLYPLPAQWDIIHKKWKPYFVKEDWWVQYYPADNFKRPTGPTCDGCHSVGYDITTKRPVEWNVGCEKCHGPGSDHVSNPTTDNIVNPSRLNFVDANDTCIQCHSQGRPLKNPIEGRYYDWPVGFSMGQSLSDYWKLEEHKLGETSFYYFPDGTAHKNRMQGNDFAHSLMYTHGVTCFTCHDPHDSRNTAMLRKPPAELCLDCHKPPSANGPFATSIEAHTHHKPGSPGSQCIACHMPQIQQTLPDVFVRAHTFKFIPQACNQCHSDQPGDWAVQALKNWNTVSPWRSSR